MLAAIRSKTLGEKTAMAMVIVFLLIVVLHALAAIFIAYKNDFSFRLLSVFLPAVGSMILSLYLAFNTFFIEAPAATNASFSVVLARNLKTGDYSSLYTPRLDGRIERMQYSMGLLQLELLKTEMIKNGINYPELMKRHDDRDEDSGALMLDMLEAAFFRWLNGSGNWVYGKDDGIVIGLMGSLPKVYSTRMDELARIPAKTKAGASNRFSPNDDFALMLPKDTRLLRSTDSGSRLIELHSPNTATSIRFLRRMGGIFSSGIPYTDQILNAIRWPPARDTYWYDVFDFQFKLTTVGPYRFSERTEAETTWFNRLKDGFEKSFSWETARQNFID